MAMETLKWGQSLFGAICVMGGRETAVGGIQFVDVTRESGVTFRHTDGSGGRRYIVESVSAGLALFDFDRDGDIDIYFVNGAPLRGTAADADASNRLYRNEGNWRFTDVTARAKVGDRGFGLGVAVGDYDNDGDLDLFVANYLGFTYDKHVQLTSQGISIYADPSDFPPMANSLFRNNGNGTFTDVSVASGVAEHAGWGMGGICADYDADGDTDIDVANDVYANFLFRNDGTGKFEAVALMAGVAYDAQGGEQASMGVECVECIDFDNDGRLDFYQTSYAKELATLHRNLGDGLFADVTLLTGAGTGTFADVTWGTGLVDFDNDGDRDIFVATGHVQDNIERYDNAATSATPNVLVLNQGEGTFVDVSERSGDGMRGAWRSRGAAFDDLDNDGDV